MGGGGLNLNPAYVLISSLRVVPRTPPHQPADDHHPRVLISSLRVVPRTHRQARHRQARHRFDLFTQSSSPHTVGGLRFFLWISVLISSLRVVPRTLDKIEALFAAFTSFDLFTQSSSPHTLQVCPPVSTAGRFDLFTQSSSPHDPVFDPVIDPVLEF